MTLLRIPKILHLFRRYARGEFGVRNPFYVVFIECGIEDLRKLSSNFVKNLSQDIQKDWQDARINMTLPVRNDRLCLHCVFDRGRATLSVFDNTGPVGKKIHDIEIDLEALDPKALQRFKTTGSSDDVLQMARRLQAELAGHGIDFGNRNLGARGTFRLIGLWCDEIGGAARDYIALRSPPGFGLN